MALTTQQEHCPPVNGDQQVVRNGQLEDLTLAAADKFVAGGEGFWTPLLRSRSDANPPILRGGLENADLFPMSGPASWCILIPKRYCKKIGRD
jgi:hypothetical protein